MSLTNTTSMVILSAVVASVISEVGLGSEPAFKVPEYDFRSPGGKFHKLSSSFENTIPFVFFFIILHVIG